MLAAGDFFRVEFTWSIPATSEGNSMDPENQTPPAFTFDDSVVGVGDEILEKMPDVQEHAVAAHEEKQQEAAANVETDDEGTPFDPAIHTGTKLKNGTWRKKKNATANPGSIVAPSRKKTASAGAADATPQADPNAEAVATGTVIATMFLGACQSIGGEEWTPTQHEREFQTAAWQAYCVAKNMKELSPGLALFIAIGSYVGPRFAKPKTAAKLGRVKNWAGLRIAKWKLKRELKKRGITAQVVIDGDTVYINGKPADEAPELK